MTCSFVISGTAFPVMHCHILQHLHCVCPEIVTVLLAKFTVFWDMALCHLEELAVSIFLVAVWSILLWRRRQQPPLKRQ